METKRKEGLGEVASKRVQSIKEAEKTFAPIYGNKKREPMLSCKEALNPIIDRRAYSEHYKDLQRVTEDLRKDEGGAGNGTAIHKTP